MAVIRILPEEVGRVPRDGGTYLLLFHFPRSMTVAVGKLGTLHLEPGFYVYVGSARGSGGLAARLRRHLRLEKRLHWHIDYVTQRARPTAIFYTTSPQVRECDWVQRLLRRSGTTVPLAGMGSGDCRAGCPAHFLGVDEETVRRLAQILAGA